MRFKRYINNISANDAHTNGDNATQGSQQSSYQVRKDIDASRRQVGGYSQSLLGNRFLQARHNYQHSSLRTGADSQLNAATGSNQTRQEVNTGLSSDSQRLQRGLRGAANRQEMNSRVQSQQPRFKEPPSRGYNPYQ